MAINPDPGAGGGPPERLPEEAAVLQETDPETDMGAPVVHYHFPVEIEVRAAPEAADPRAAAQLALRWLTQGLHGL
jgi:hypothetical protein